MWLALARIQLGTVLIEEIAFRGVLPALLGASERWRPVLSASVLFGLRHLLPSLALAQNAAVNQTACGLPLATASVLATVAAAGPAYSCAGGATPSAGCSPRCRGANSGGSVLGWALVPR
ncbi:CPBP family glutamic-type intramembrane protease [Amycolatopsis sp. NPDC004079]|uniref:CPBP family glutamic-type intramembrane protease n=1 Tax=Amycolatopsis sp. NPDC004079 TaxID=3154549 RepID=UPI0033B30A9E